MADGSACSPDCTKQTYEITFHILIQTAYHMSLSVKSSGKSLIRAFSDGCPVFATEADVVAEHRIQTTLSLVDLICKPGKLIAAGNLVNSVFICLRFRLCHTIPGSGLRNLINDGINLIFRLFQKLVQFCHSLRFLQIADKSITDKFDFVHPHHIIVLGSTVIRQHLHCICPDFLQFLICSK